MRRKLRLHKTNYPALVQLTPSPLHIKCPECAGSAVLSDGFEEVCCEHCGYRATYGQYVSRLVEKDASYRDILNDYR